MRKELEAFLQAKWPYKENLQVSKLHDNLQSFEKVYKLLNYHAGQSIPKLADLFLEFS